MKEIPEHVVGARVYAALHDERYAGSATLTKVFEDRTCYVVTDADGMTVATHLDVLTPLDEGAAKGDAP